MSDRITVTRESRPLKAFCNAHADRPAHETWFLTRNSTAPTGGQAWRYVMDERKWLSDVVFAVYDPRSGAWLPLRVGDQIVRQDGGHAVLRPFEQEETP